MEERFRMTKASLLIAHYLNPRMRKRLVPGRTNKFHMDPVGTEVQTTINFFVNLIAACSANQHQSVVIGGKKQIKNRSQMLGMLSRASALPKRQWWEEGQVMKKLDAQVEHMRIKWVTDEYCKFAHPWFQDAFVQNVRAKQRSGLDWQGMFDVVPDALTGSEGGSDSDSGATFPSEVQEGEESSGDDDPSSAAADVSENSEGGSSRDLEEEKVVMQSGEEEEEGRMGDGAEDGILKSQSEGTEAENEGSSDDSRASGRGLINAAASRKRSRRRSAELKRRRKRKLEGGDGSGAPRGSLQLARDKGTRRQERGFYKTLEQYGWQR